MQNLITDDNYRGNLKVGPCDQTEDGTVHSTVSVYPSPPKGHQAATEGAGEALPGPHQTGERPERAQGKLEENQG